MIDGRQEIPSWSQTDIEQFCHRRFGIGADGLIILAPAEGFDFRMIYYNSDGRESTMCGNGGRCIAQFAHDLGMGNSFRFIAIDGPHLAEVEAKRVRLQMIDVPTIEARGTDWFTDTGSPHHVVLHPNPDELNIVTAARTIRNSEPYKKAGVNVNFMTGEGQNWEMRTYERGVEDETYSCGTGVTAAALVAHYSGKAPLSPIHMRTKGGKLSLSFEHSPEKGYFNIWLEGPAEKVFEGFAK
tara:strand:+ start:1038 stop:1760 length:723 start_codon:yes stop_codon:yes gene_type:complete